MPREPAFNNNPQYVKCIKFKSYHQSYDPEKISLIFAFWEGPTSRGQVETPLYQLRLIVLVPFRREIIWAEREWEGVYLMSEKVYFQVQISPPFLDSRFKFKLLYNTHNIKERVKLETLGRLTKTRYNNIAHLFDRKRNKNKCIK